MPVLKEYAESNDKNGYYIHAPISGRDHPLPLQTPEVTEEIYRELGYKPIEPGHDGGVPVPNELTWTLHNVGLHWTESSGPRGEPEDLDPDKLREDTGPELTEADINTILDLTEEYRGQYQAQVKDLRNELELDAKDKSTTSEPSSGVITVEELLESHSDGPSFNEDVKAMLERWEPGNIVDDNHEHEHKIGRALSTPRSEYLEALSAVPELKNHLQEYADHPWEIDSVRATTAETGDGSRGLKISFQDSSAPKMENWSITEYRGTDSDYDIEVSASIDTRSFKLEITDGYISDFHTAVSHQSTGRFDLPPEDFWGFQIEDENPNEVMHALVSDFSHLIPVVAEFFDDLPSYELESTELGGQSVHLP